MKDVINYKRSIFYEGLINCSISKLWKIISIESNLELFHPFCKYNRIIEWSNENSIDEIEYLNGLILRRKFCRWVDNSGYDLYINQKGRPSSNVIWRIMEKRDKCRISITVYPYLFNQGKKIIDIFPFYIFVKPLIKKYLKSVIGGLKWYTEKEIPIRKNQFGRHIWFS